MVVGAVMAPERQDDMWVNIVSRSAQLIALALAGGVVGAVIHDRDAAREAHARRAAFLEGFLDELESAYVQVKASRRLLRASGFDGQREVPLTETQAEGFRTQLAQLSDAELQFETMARRVTALPAPYGAAAGEVVAQLEGIHDYLNGVLREWEATPVDMTTGATLAWPRFCGFVAYEDGVDHAFRAGVADRILAIEIALQELVA